MADFVHKRGFLDVRCVTGAHFHRSRSETGLADTFKDNRVEFLLGKHAAEVSESERSQESLVAWLKSHPVAAEVQIANRDRSNIYREGLVKGAPGATHVADRWHLLHNLVGALERPRVRGRRPAFARALVVGFDFACAEVRVRGAGVATASENQLVTT